MMEFFKSMDNFKNNLASQQGTSEEFELVEDEDWPF